MSLNTGNQRQLRRPLVGIAISFLIGAGFSACWPLNIGLLFFAALFTLLLSLLCMKTAASSWLLLICCGCLAACHYTVSISCLTQHTVQRRYAQTPVGQVHIEGRIVGAPEFYPYSSGGLGSWIFPLECCGEKTADGWRELDGRISVRVSESRRSDRFVYGERRYFSGILKQRRYPFPHEKLALTVSPYDHRQRLAGPRFSLIYWGLRLRAAAAVTLTRGLERFPEPAAILKALLLGYRKALPQETYEKFARTGTLHIFAISGLHVGMVGVLIVSILKAIGIPRKYWGIWLLPLLLLYVLGTGMKSSAFRALAMAALYFLAPLFGRRPDVPSSIAFAAIVLLLVAPSQITSAGFIFSFAVVSSIVMVFSTIPERVYAPFADPMKAAEPAPVWAVVKRVWRYSVSLVITSLAAALASIPLAARFFNSFSPVSLIGNIFVVPLTFVIILTGWLSIILGASSVFTAEIFNHANRIFVEGLLLVVHLLDSLPGAYCYVAAPPLFTVLLWFTGWILLLTHTRTLRQRFVPVLLIFAAICWVVTSSVMQKSTYDTRSVSEQPAETGFPDLGNSR